MLDVNLIMFTDTEELIDYINNGSDNNRAEDRIKRFNVFSHGFAPNGNAGSIEFAHSTGLDSDSTKKLSLTIDKIKNGKLKEEAFDDTSSMFYSCNTGTGDEKNSFAQNWVNITGGTTTAAIGSTYYGNINFYKGYEIEWAGYRTMRAIYVRGYSSPFMSFKLPELSKNATWKDFKKVK